MTNGPGILISKGTTLSIPGFVLSIGPDGVKSGPVVPHLSIDMCPRWLALAIDHLDQCGTAASDAVQASASNDDNALADALERESAAGMQAIMSAAIALDAFYAQLKERVVISKDLLSAWRKNKTARPTQIAETSRLAFDVKAKSIDHLRLVLEEIFRFRDTAVHPPAEAKQAILRPDINRGVEWRFVAFRYENALPLTRGSLSVITQLTGRPKEGLPALTKYCGECHAAVTSLVTRWEAKYGLLYPREPELSNE